MTALLVALSVGADTGIDTRISGILGPTLRLGDHPRVIDIDLPSHPDLAVEFLHRLATAAIDLAQQITTPSTTST